MAKKQFQTEVNQLLQFIIHSLYSNKDIFLREIVSNASDALEKLQYLNVSDDAYKSIKFTPKIDISFNRDKGVISVSDTGIGMSDSDLTENLGTIAKSGTKNFLMSLKDNSDAQKNTNLIGQFGVGFYSAFMVSKSIDVYTRRAASDGKIWHWVSDGVDSYDIDEISADSDAAKEYGFADPNKTGSTIVMTLNDDDKEYAAKWRIDEIVKKYNNHIPFPIFLHYDENNYDDKGNVKSTENKCEQINAATALWKRPKSELTPNDYNEFYKSISHNSDDPLHYVHTHAEGTQEYTTLFYVPSQAPFDMYHADYKGNIKLYIKRVFITDDNRELLPGYLRFVYGVIDSEDLPLNVSREILQQNRILESIKAASVKKLLSEFRKMGDDAKSAHEAMAGDTSAMSEDDKKKNEAAIANWNKFVTNFNRPIKEGLYGDYANRDEIAEIVRFKSTDASGTGDDSWTSFSDYVGRMKDGQKAIYYITGTDESNLRANPLLAAYKDKGFEVLIMTDDIDEVVFPSFGKYKDYELKAVDRANSDEELGVDKDAAAKKEEEYKDVAEKIKKALGDAVKDVKISKRLTADSPSCVVIDENDPGYQMERMMRAMGQGDMYQTKPILEINADNALVQRVKDTTDEGLISDISQVLLSQALLIAGVELKTPATFVKSLNALLTNTNRQ